MRFTLRQLSYFVAAGETGSITLASERVHISQPSVSAAVSSLEAQFGIQLFIRHHAQGLSLTPAGERVLAAVKLLLRQAEGINDLADEITTKVTGPLKIGIFRTVSPLLIPDLCVPFVRQFADVALDIFEGDESALFARLRKGELDMAISYQQQAVDIDFRPLGELPTYVLLAADHPLAQRPLLKLVDLANEDFILLDLPVSRDYFRSLFEKRGVPLRIRAASEQPETVRSYVAAGVGFSLMTARPTNQSALTGKPLAYVALDEQFPPMVLGLATLAGIRRTRAMQAFEDHCRVSAQNGSLTA